MVNEEIVRGSVLRGVPEDPDGKTGEILRAVQILRQPGEIAEIRAFSSRATISGYFDNFGELAKCAAELDDRGCQVYMTLNPLSCRRSWRDLRTAWSLV